MVVVCRFLFWSMNPLLLVIFAKDLNLHFFHYIFSSAYVWSSHKYKEFLCGKKWVNWNVILLIDGVDCIYGKLVRSFFNVWKKYFYFCVLESQHNNSLTETKVAQTGEANTLSVWKKRERERRKTAWGILFIFLPRQILTVRNEWTLKVFLVIQAKCKGLFFFVDKKKVKSLLTGTDLWRIVRLFLLCGQTSGCSHCSRPLWADGSGFVQFTLDNFPVFPAISLLAPLTPSTPAFVLRRLVDVAFDVAAAHCKGYIASVLWVAACVPPRWNKREVLRGNK